METASDRRSPGAERIPFDGLVEVGGSLGPTFEAQARDLSRDGLGLHAAYLPELGQPLSCRFESGTSQVICEGEVAWKHEGDRGGEFGIRFTNLDRTSEDALSRMLQEQQMQNGAAEPVLAGGTKLRLHIEGLGAPMRARVKTADYGQMTAYSDLSFLKLGKELELEDAVTGGRRAARIDDVDLELHPETRVPQLVVSLSYGEGLNSIPATRHAASSESTSRKAAKSARSVTLPGISAADEHEDSDNAAEDGGKLFATKAAVANGIAKVTPALSEFGNKAKGFGSALMQKLHNARNPDTSSSQRAESPAPRRTTAKAPTGGLHATGRKIHRSEGNEQLVEKAAVAGSGLLASPKRKMAFGGAVVIALGLAIAAGRKSEPAAAVAPIASAAVEPVAPAPTAVAAAPALSAVPVAIGVAGGSLAGLGDPSEGAGAVQDAPGGSLQPFGHGTVTNGNVLHLKMDGKIERLQGAAQPTGFTVVIPKRRGVEAAAALLRKDSRIAEVHLNNQPTGAEISMTFKDGVPPYLVRAKGDTLELVLGRPGEAGDNKTAKGHAKPTGKGHGVEQAAHRAHPKR